MHTDEQIDLLQITDNTLSPVGIISQGVHHMAWCSMLRPPSRTADSLRLGCIHLMRCTYTPIYIYCPHALAHQSLPTEVMCDPQVCVAGPTLYVSDKDGMC